MEVFFIVISEFAHIIKYAYYLLSSYTNVTRIFLFLKLAKPITILLQLIEFLLIFVHSAVALKADCNLSSLFYVQIINVLVLLLLYAKLFVKHYLIGHNVKC